MQARHRVLLREGHVVRGAERPDVQRDFEQEEGGDAERDVREDLEPRGGLLAARVGGRGTGVGEEGVDEVGEHAGRVDHDLRCTKVCAMTCAQ